MSWLVSSPEHSVVIQVQDFKPGMVAYFTVNVSVTNSENPLKQDLAE